MPELGTALHKVLLGVTPACADSVDRYVIATYVKSQVVDKQKLKSGTDAWTRAQAVESSARGVIAANPPPVTAVNTSGTTGTTGHHTPPPRHSTTATP